MQDFVQNFHLKTLPNIVRIRIFSEVGSGINSSEFTTQHRATHLRFEAYPNIDTEANLL
jgi:hypothetical protein